MTQTSTFRELPFSSELSQSLFLWDTLAFEPYDLWWPFLRKQEYTHPPNPQYC